MACGVPVVGSTCGEIPTTIGEAGLTFEEGNVDRLASHLERLSGSEEERSKWRDLGLRRVRTHYSWRSLADRTYEIYRGLLE
jgi:glycosyltransferase involved in cell wall biosynthesis